VQLREPELRPPRELFDSHARAGEHSALGRLGRLEVFRIPARLVNLLGSLAATRLLSALHWRPPCPDLRQREVALPDLPDGLVGLRVAHVTDVHCSEFFTTGDLERLKRRVAALAPDLVLITGDLLHRDDRVLAELGRALAGLGPPGTVFAVRGNHDRQVDPRGRRFAEVLRAAGVILLDNTAAEARLPGRPRLWIAGIDDIWEGEPDLEAALDAVPSGRPYLLLTHSPDTAESLLSLEHRPLLVLAGHTHGGQVVLPLFGPLVLPSAHGTRYQAGLVRRKGLTVQVSRGVGVVEPPLRIGAPAEVPILCLRKAGPGDGQQ